MRWVFVAMPVALLVTGCGGVGACLGVNGIFGNDYCYSDFDEAECNDYRAQEINAASWTFHSGDTCADLGYSES